MRHMAFTVVIKDGKSQYVRFCGSRHHSGSEPLNGKPYKPVIKVLENVYKKVGYTSFETILDIG